MKKTKDWAKNEIDKVLKSAVCDEYSAACLKSAYKAFKSLTNDGYSGTSIQYTKNILDRLIELKPLSSIMEEDFENVKPEIANDKKWLDAMGLIDDIQCPRYTALFKYIHKDGTISYRDVCRAVFIDGDSAWWHSGMADKIVDELFPISLPYYPPLESYKVYGRTYFEDDNGNEVENAEEFNIEEFFYVITPDGEKIDLNRKYKDGKLV